MRLTTEQLDALEAALARYNEGAILHYSLFELSYAALPALIAAARATVPEVIGAKHKDGQWWMVWDEDCLDWVKARWIDVWQKWERSGRDGLMGTPTHALPMPEAPDA